MDVHVPRAITQGLRLRGIETLTAQQDGADRLGDPALLDRVKALGRVLFTRDADLLAECRRRQQGGSGFNGLIYAHQLHVTIGQCVRDLQLLAAHGDPAEFVGQVVYLPFR